MWPPSHQAAATVTLPTRNLACQITQPVQATQAFPARVFRAGGPGQASFRTSSPSAIHP